MNSENTSDPYLKQGLHTNVSEPWQPFYRRSLLIEPWTMLQKLLTDFQDLAAEPLRVCPGLAMQVGSSGLTMYIYIYMVHELVWPGHCVPLRYLDPFQHFLPLDEDTCAPSFGWGPGRAYSPPLRYSTTSFASESDVPIVSSRMPDGIPQDQKQLQ